MEISVLKTSAYCGGEAVKVKMISCKEKSDQLQFTSLLLLLIICILVVSRSPSHELGPHFFKTQYKLNKKIAPAAKSS